jgi:hypothetical protein
LEPNAPKMTLLRGRFIALHMSRVRMSPLAPTNPPPISRAVFPRTNPARPAAHPVKELRSEMTTGISAPPMGRTRVTPSISAKARSPKNGGSIRPLLRRTKINPIAQSR